MWALGWGAPWGGKGAGGWGKKGGGERTPVSPPTPTGETYAGTIKSISSKFGFIEAAEVTAAYSCDVFCLPSQLQGFAVGQQVQFTVGVNKEGKPQALEITALGPPPPGAVTGDSSGKGFGKFGGGKSAVWTKQGGGPEPTGEVYKGTIKSVSERFGFIQCPEVEALYGCDTFCLGNQLIGYTAGQKVEFSVGLNKEGKPQAVEIKPIGPWKPAPAKSSGKGWGPWGGPGMGMGGWGGGWADWGPWGYDPWGMGMKGFGGKGFGGKGKDSFGAFGGIKRKTESTGETVTGVVKSSSSKFGFVESEEITAKFGQDCFCTGEQLVGFNVGDLVVVEVGISPKGQPQAVNIASIDGGVKQPLFKMQRTA